MNRVREFREAMGLRQEALAARADVSYSYVRMLEGDDAPTPRLALARRLAAALETTVDYLFPPLPPQVGVSHDEAPSGVQIKGGK